MIILFPLKNTAGKLSTLERLEKAERMKITDQSKLLNPSVLQLKQTQELSGLGQI